MKISFSCKGHIFACDLHHCEKKVSEVTKHKAMVQSCLLFKAGHSSNLKCSKLCLVLPILTYFKLVLVKLLILGPPN